MVVRELLSGFVLVRYLLVCRGAEGGFGFGSGWFSRYFCLCIVIYLRIDRWEVY